MSLSDLLKFQLNEHSIRVAKVDVWRSDILLDWPTSDLEKCHNFVQWLLPTTVKSEFHPEAPTLTPDDIKMIKKCLPVFKQLFVSNVDVLGVALWGFKFKNDNYVIHDEKMASIWTKAYDHNFRRFSRALQCLMMVEEYDRAHKLFLAVARHHVKHCNPPNKDTIKIWSQLVTRPKTMTSDDIEEFSD